MSKKKEKGAKHGDPGAELGQGGIMKKHLVYNRAYKRVRADELKQGRTDEEAKRVERQALLLARRSRPLETSPSKR